MIRFSSPAVLAGLLLLPLIAAAMWGRRGQRALTVLRLCAVCLLVLGAAGLEVRRAAPDLAVVVAADRSDSIGPEGARQIRGFIDELRSLAGPGRSLGLVAFGAEALLEEAPNRSPRLAFASLPRPDGTDLAAALRAAGEAIPLGAAGRIVLLTDGQVNAGDLAPELARAKARGIEIAVLPVGAEQVPDVLVEEVMMPARVSVGERLPVSVLLRANLTAEVSVRVRANRSLIHSQEMVLSPGRTVLDLEPVATQPGLLRVEATVEAQSDREPGNNRAFALGMVEGRPHVLYVGVPLGPLAGLLETQGLAVKRLPPAELPGSVAAYQGVAAVVLDDVPAYQLSPSQMAALRDYVRAVGGGLLAVGGSHSFGIGGYARTPLEEALPLSMDVRHRMAMPSMAVVIVLDASGSMGSYGAELAKVELAKETAQSVIDLLGESDLIGVLAFDQQPRWLSRMGPASARGAILEAVGRIQAGGGTNMYPALMAAQGALLKVEARVKHVIVLSDGQTDPGDFRALATGMAVQKITVSTVAVGKDADLEIMRNVAAWGSGRAYFARDLYSIPNIVAAEALLASRAYVVEERFAPRAARSSEILADLMPIPELRGYLAAAPKPAAEVLVSSHREDPVAAVWRFGLGRSAAVTTDARFRWTAEWASWPHAARFWSQVVRWVASRETGPISAFAEMTSDGLRVVADARSADGEPVVAWEIQTTVIGDEGGVASAPLRQTRPGWYEATLPRPGAGAYLVRVLASEGGRVVGRADLPVAVPYSPELRAVGLNRAVISQLVEAGEARVISSAAEALAPHSAPAAQFLGLWHVLAGSALAGFVAEIALRRVPALGYQLGRIAALVSGSSRYTPPPEQAAAEAEYAAADQWKDESPQEAAARAASMAAAARIYITRLRRSQAREREDRP